jgi:hypothetical protein
MVTDDSVDVAVNAEGSSTDIAAIKQEHLAALERDRAFLSSYLELGQDINKSVEAALTTSEPDRSLAALPEKIEQTLTGALRLGQELQDLRRAHMSLQEAHMQLRSDHALLQELVAGAGKHSAVAQPVSDSLLPSARLPSREAKDYQVRGMLQKLTQDYQVSSDQMPSDYQAKSSQQLQLAPLWATLPPPASPKQRRSQSVSVLNTKKDLEPFGSMATGIGAPLSTIPINSMFGPSGGAGGTQLSSVGRMTIAQNPSTSSLAAMPSAMPQLPTSADGARFPRGRPGTSERAAVRDALSELLYGGLGVHQPRDRLGTRCRSH